MEHIPTNIKCSIDPNFHTNLLHDNEKFQNALQNRFTFKQGTLVNVNTDDSIEIQTPTGSSETIKYDYLVICTGFKYDNPIRDNNAISISDRQKSLGEFY